jgi:hypothetical protein
VLGGLLECCVGGGDHARCEAYRTMVQLTVMASRTQQDASMKFLCTAVTSHQSFELGMIPTNALLGLIPVHYWPPPNTTTLWLLQV